MNRNIIIPAKVVCKLLRENITDKHQDVTQDVIMKTTFSLKSHIAMLPWVIFVDSRKSGGATQPSNTYKVMSMSHLTLGSNVPGGVGEKCQLVISGKYRMDSARSLSSLQSQAWKDVDDGAAASSTFSHVRMMSSMWLVLKVQKESKGCTSMGTLVFTRAFLKYCRGERPLSKNL